MVQPLPDVGGSGRGAEWAMRPGQRSRHDRSGKGAVGLFHWHIQENRIASTPMANRLLGLPADQPISFADLRERIHPDDRELTIAALDEALSAAGECDLEFRIVLPDKSERWIGFIGTVARGPQGFPEHMAGVVLDVSERRRHESERDALLAAERAARHEAERQVRLKDEFLARLSHELRAPLTTMLGWAQMLRRGKLGSAEMGEAIKSIESSVYIQKRLIEDLLDISRITSGKLRLNVEPLDLGEVVEAAAASISPMAEAAGVALERNIKGDLGPVLGDRTRLQQVIWNLLSNAVKFTKSGGWVRLTARRELDRVVVVVADNGIGIAGEQLGRLFERFHQAAPADRGGLGLGLAIVKELCDMHGGSVRAESPGVGRGSTFTLELPIAALGPGGFSGLPHAPGELNAAACDVSVLAGLRVLWVEDEPDTRDVVARILREYGTKVRTAGSVAAALAELEADPPDVLISDIGMPHEDGCTLVRKIRQHKSERIAKIPAIALTALARPEDRERTLAAGYQIHVAKPVDPAMLAQAVCRVVTAQPPGGHGRR